MVRKKPNSKLRLLSRYVRGHRRPLERPLARTDARDRLDHRFTFERETATGSVIKGRVAAADQIVDGTHGIQVGWAGYSGVSFIGPDVALQDLPPSPVQSGDYR